jgi:butyryl-CoA dehydrogenase
MVYNLTEDQRLIQQMVREFAEKEVRPIAAEMDRQHRFPIESVARMAELGLFGLSVPQEYGGSGSDALSYILAVEELARVSATHALILSVHVSVCIAPILLAGTEQQKMKYIPDLAAGRKLGAFAITESGAGSDAAGQTATAVCKNDSYILNGTKIFITNGAYAETFMVMAVTDKSKGHKGLSCFIVDKSSPGFIVGQEEDKLGMCGSSTTEIILKDCVVPAVNLLGKKNEGFKLSMEALNGGRVSIAAQGLGLAQGAYEAALDYAKKRVQFGRTLSANQGIQWELAEMALEIEAARHLVYSAARLKDAHSNYVRQSAMAKLFAARTAFSVAARSLQIHGGIGYTRSYPVERYLRDAKIIEIYEGTNEMQKTIIAKDILG